MHFLDVVGLVGCRHEFSQGRASKDPIVQQGEINYVKHNLLSLVVKLSPKCYWQHNIPFRMTPTALTP